MRGTYAEVSGDAGGFPEVSEVLGLKKHQEGRLEPEAW